MPTSHGRIWTIGTAIVVAIVLVIVVRTAQVSSHAKIFLREAVALRLRESTQDQVQALVQRFNGHVEPRSSDSMGYSYVVIFENTWLRYLRLAPLTRLSITLGTSDGVLVYRRVFLTSSDSGALVEEWLSWPGYLPGAPFHISGSSSGERYRVFVDLTPDASPAQHTAAYDLNVNCLSKIGGCVKPEQLIPSVTWK